MEIAFTKISYALHFAVSRIAKITKVLNLGFVVVYCDGIDIRFIVGNAPVSNSVDSNVHRCYGCLNSS